MFFLDPQDTPEVAIIVNKPPPPKILNEIKLQDTDLLVIARIGLRSCPWQEWRIGEDSCYIIISKEWQ